jgi:peptide/nickel transport system permease protein
VRSVLVRLVARYALLALGVILLNFFIPRLLPGDPLSFGSGEGLAAATPLSNAARRELRSYYHLDEPLGRQFLLYLDGLRRGDLGWSIARPAPVGVLILEHLPWTLALLLTSLLISTIVGTAIGFAAGWLPRRARDRIFLSAVGLLAAIPEFLIAIGLLLVFAVGLGWFPLFGGQTVFAGSSGDIAGTVRHALDIANHLVLPAATLVLVGALGFALLARDVVAGLRDEPWLAVARAKGLSEVALARRHALPNLALPLLTFFGLRLGSVLSGALVVERVFGVPGLGLLGFDAIRARDYPLLQALFLLASLGVLAANLAVETISLRLAARWGDLGA